MSKVKVGVIGCGNISATYFSAAKRFDILDIVACADIDVARAKARAEEFGIPKGCSVEELLADPEIEIVINLTIPLAHAQVSLQILEAGKHVHLEKPLAVDREEGRRVIEYARSKGLRVGCAPDTFLGGGHQTCRKLIDDGWIGTPVAATAFMLGHGHESWHPDPGFYYQKGGGPMFDMGPYYLTAMINMLGPVKRVSGSTRITFPERTITSKPKYGQKITVETPTHIAGVLDFASGAIGTIVTSFDVWHANVPFIEIYGTEGSLSVPDPNGFGGTVKVRRFNTERWEEVPLTYGFTDNSRGVGAADIAHALRTGRPHRVNGDLAFHVLDIMQALHESSDEGRHIELCSTCERPAALPLGLSNHALDD